MIIGITGGFGTGKTTVAKMFARKGAKALDADRFSHMALRRGSGTYKRIVYAFNRAVLNKNKSINKRRLAAIVFSDKQKLKKLTNIIHPFVIKKIKGYIKKMGLRDVVVIDAPLLIETNLTGIVDKLIVVKAGRKVQLPRCMRKRKFKKEEVMARVKNQMPLSKKLSMADYVIDNNGPLKETRKQVDKIWGMVRPT